MSVEYILKELEGVKAYMAARPRASGPADSVAKTFAASTHKMISASKFLGPHEAAQLSSTHSDKSPYTVSDTKHRVGAIGNKVGDMSIAKGGSTSSGKKGQLLEHWCNCLTRTDLDLLHARRQHLSAKMTRLVERGTWLGLLVYDEHTYKWLLALLSAVLYPQVSDAHFLLPSLTS